MDLNSCVSLLRPWTHCADLFDAPAAHAELEVLPFEPREEREQQNSAQKSVREREEKKESEERSRKERGREESGCENGRKERGEEVMRAFPFLPRMYQCDTLFWSLFYLVKTVRPPTSESFAQSTNRAETAWMFEPPTFVAEKQHKMKYADEFNNHKAAMKANGLFPYVHIKNNIADMGERACLSPKAFFALCLMENINAVMVGCMPPPVSNPAQSTPILCPVRLSHQKPVPRYEESEVRLVHKLICDCDNDSPIFLIFQLPVWNGKRKEWGFYYYVVWEATPADVSHYANMESCMVPLAKCSTSAVCSEIVVKKPKTRRKKTGAAAAATTIITTTVVDEEDDALVDGAMSP